MRNRQRVSWSVLQISKAVNNWHQIWHIVIFHSTTLHIWRWVISDLFWHLFSNNICCYRQCSEISHINIMCVSIDCWKIYHVVTTIVVPPTHWTLWDQRFIGSSRFRKNLDNVVGADIQISCSSKCLKFSPMNRTFVVLKGPRPNIWSNTRLPYLREIPNFVYPDLEPSF